MIIDTIIFGSVMRQGRLAEGVRRLEAGVRKLHISVAGWVSNAHSRQPQIRNRAPGQALKLLELPANVIPFHEFGVLRAHAQIEISQFDAADRILQAVDPFKRLKVVVDDVRKLGHFRRTSSVVESEVNRFREKIWEQELDLLPRIIAA